MGLASAMACYSVSPAMARGSPLIDAGIFVLDQLTALIDASARLAKALGVSQESFRSLLCSLKDEGADACGIVSARTNAPAIGKVQLDLCSAKVMKDGRFGRHTVIRNEPIPRIELPSGQFHMIPVASVLTERHKRTIRRNGEQAFFLLKTAADEKFVIVV